MIFTFYSYKGGVGRSLAMACAAHAFAERGLRVLAVDFDLEAPGLERYFFDGDEAGSRRAQPGLIDLVLAYRRALTSDAEFERAEFREWRNFRQTVRDPINQRGGMLDLMTAGQREPDERMRDYALTVRSFDWQDFFSNWKGDRFFEWLQREWTDPNSGYDVVLIDSRTGVTEMGGVCAYQLADVVLLLCAPNYQNLDGTRKVVTDFLSEGVMSLRRGRPLEILALPARLEEDHPKREQFLVDFERELGSDAMPARLALAGVGLSYRSLALPYQQAFSISERLVGEAPADDGGGTSRLVDALTLLAPPSTALGAQQGEALSRLQGHGGEHRAVELQLEADTTRISSGFDALIECRRSDAPIAQALHIALEAAGCRVASTYDAVEPGVRWREAFELQLRYSNTVLMCFGADGVSQFSEQLIARVRSMGHARILPVLLPGADDAAPRSLGLEASQAIDLRRWQRGENGDALLRPLVNLLRGRHERLQPTAAAPAPPHDPYPGARAFREDEATFFAGRSKKVADLVTRLREHDIVVLQGAAGVGKSSLLHAGLLPTLRVGLTGLSVPQRLIAFDAAAAQPGRLPDGAACLLAVDHLDSDPAAAHLGAVLEWISAMPPGSKALLLWRGAWSDAQNDRIVAALRSRRVATVQLQALEGEALREAIEVPARHAGHLLEPGLTERLIESTGAAQSRALQLQLALAHLWIERRRGWLTNKCLDAAGHLGGLFVAHRQRVMATLPEAERDAAVVLFKTLSALDADQRLTPNTLAWRVVETVPMLRRAGADTLRNRLAGAGLIDLWRRDDALPGAEGEQPAMMVALVRPDPLQYFDSGGQVPDLPFFLWRAGSATYVQHWLASGRRDDALLSGRALDEAEHWQSMRPDELTADESSLIDASAKARKAFFERAEAERAAQLETAQRLQAAEHDRAELQTRVAQQAQAAQHKVTQRFRQTLGVALGAVGLAVFAGYAWFKVFQESDAKDRALREATVINAASEAQATLLKLRPGSDIRALLQLAAARRMSDKPEIAALAIEGLLAQPGLRHITELAGDVGAAYAFNASASHLVYVGAGRRLVVMEIATGRRVVTEAAPLPPKAMRLALSDDGRVALRQDTEGGRVWRYDASGRGAPTLQLGPEAPEPPPQRGAYDLDMGSTAQPLLGGRFGVAADARNVRAWSLEVDAKDADPRHEPWLLPQVQGAQAMAFDAAGTTLAVVDQQGRIAVAQLPQRALRMLSVRWPDAEATRKPANLEVVASKPRIAVALSGDGARLAIAGGRTGVQLFDTASGKLLHSLGKDDVDLMRFSPDGKRLAAYSSRVVPGIEMLRVWDLASGRAIGDAAREPIAALAFSPDGESLYTASADATLRQWNARLDVPFGKLLEGTVGRTWGVGYLPDGKSLFAVSEDGRLRRWNVATGTLEAATPAGLSKANENLTSVSVNADGSRVATGSSLGALRIWRARDLAPLAEATASDQSMLYGVGFLENTRLVSGATNGEVQLWNVEPTRLDPVKTYKTSGSLSSLTTHATAGLVAAGDDKGGVMLWRIGGAGLTEALRTQRRDSRLDRVDALAFDTRGRTLVIGGGTTALLDVATVTLGRTFASLNYPWALAFSADGRLLAGGSSGRDLRLWNVADGTVASPSIRLPLGTRVGEEPSLEVGGVVSLAFSPDGTGLAVGGDAGLLWLLPHPDRWLDALCTRVGRNLSNAEWKRWVSPALSYVEQCPGLPKPADADTPEGAVASASAGVTVPGPTPSTASAPSAALK